MTPFVSGRTAADGRKLVASDSKRTNWPASEIAGSRDAPLPVPLKADREIQRWVGGDVLMSARTTSVVPLWSRSSRSVASVWYAT